MEIHWALSEMKYADGNGSPLFINNGSVKKGVEGRNSNELSRCLEELMWVRMFYNSTAQPQQSELIIALVR
jgi:hypothetical protein